MTDGPSSPARRNGAPMHSPAPRGDAFDAILGHAGMFRFGSTDRPAVFDARDPVRRIENGYVIVFARTPFLVAPVGRPPFVADSSAATFANLGQEYRARPLTPDGIRTNWLAIGREAAADAVRPFDPTAADRGDRPFVARQAPINGPAHLTQRLLFDRASRGYAFDALHAEETLVGLVSSLIAAAFGLHRRPGRTRPATERAHRTGVEAVRELLAARFHEAWTMDALGREVHMSPFHLAHVFRALTGASMHQHRERVRTRAAMERILDGARDLTALAHELGYSSHSHFTRSFRRQFGVAPSAVRPGALDN